MTSNHSVPLAIQEPDLNNDFVKRFNINKNNDEMSLKFGSYIVINFLNERGSTDKKTIRKLTTNYRISEKAQTLPIHNNSYDENGVFRVIPSCQYEMQNIIKNIIESSILPENVDVDYENFMTELETNLELQSRLMGMEIKYGTKFQLYHQSSKRFLGIIPADKLTVKQAFEGSFTDSFGFQFGFSEYSTSLTHFTFEECCQFQKRNDLIISNLHYGYLTTKFGTHTIFAGAKGKYPFMTESYFTSISFDILKESNTFNEKGDVYHNEIVLIKYANDNIYINVHSFVINSDSPESKTEYNLDFQAWNDFKDVDVNAWFSIEYDQESDKVHLKHFNTNKYLTVYNMIGIRDKITLESNKSENSQFSFEPLGSNESDVLSFTTDTVFKIMSTPGEATISESFLRVADRFDIADLNKDQENNGIMYQFQEDIIETSNKIPFVVKGECPINKYDTFSLVFPQMNSYRELVFGKDINIYLSNFIETLKKYSEPLKFINENLSALTEIFWSIYAFLNNELAGRIKSKYLVGEIIPYRQKLVTKIGIGESIFSFLEFLTDIEIEDGQNNWEHVMKNTFEIHDPKYKNYMNSLDLIFDTIFLFVNENSDVKVLASKYLKVLQNFVFIDKLAAVLCAILKRKKSSMNLQILKTKPYFRIYEYSRVKPLVENYVEIIKRVKNKRYMYTLRKLGVINNNPLPLVQNLVLRKLYFENEDNLMLKIEYNMNGNPSNVSIK